MSENSHTQRQREQRRLLRIQSRERRDALAEALGNFHEGEQVEIETYRGQKHRGEISVRRGKNARILGIVLVTPFGAMPFTPSTIKTVTRVL